MVRRVFTIGLIGLFLVLGLGAAGAAWLHAQFTGPGPATEAVTLVLPRGDGLQAIGRRLQADGVISDARVFALGARLGGHQAALQAGEYRFPAGISMREAIALLRSGRTVVRKLTVPEGLTSAEVVALLEATDGLAGGIAAVPAEGSLLPETYHFSYGDPRQQIVERMDAAMNAVLAELWPRRVEGLPLDGPEQAVILASLVEKETGQPDERAHIAGVFVNRLRRGMRLQSDPTVAYALSTPGRPLDRSLTRADLAVDSPYNTYRNHGLPPGPIANPGRAAIAAVLQPLVTEDLYFVADGSGGHAFARTYDEHRRNVRRWRGLRDARQADD